MIPKVIYLYWRARFNNSLCVSVVVRAALPMAAKLPVVASEIKCLCVLGPVRQLELHLELEMKKAAPRLWNSYRKVAILNQFVPELHEHEPYEHCLARPTLPSSDHLYKLRKFVFLRPIQQ